MKNKIKVRLERSNGSLSGCFYRVEQIVGAVTIDIAKASFGAGDALQPTQAEALALDKKYEVTTVCRK